MDKDTKEIKNKKNTFSILLKRLREKNKITQQTLSITSGISRQHISEIETKGVIPSMLTQEALAKGFKMSYSDFLSLFNKEYKALVLLEKKGLSKDEYLKVAELNKKKGYNI